MNFENKRIHLIGIGGICISGIAKILISKKCIISGSDISENNNILLLKKLGAKIYINHSSNNINSEIDYVIYSSAIKNNNVEIITAKKLNIKILSRGECLKIISNLFNNIISISGTHGKTTTTSMLISIFKYNNLNPTFLNGGIIKDINYSSNLGNYKYFVIESDESDLSFLKLNPNIVIITNIDNDHIRSYDNNINKLKSAFIKFSNSINNNFVVLCYDDSNNRSIIPYIKNKIYTYGFDLNSDFIIKNYIQKNNFSSFSIHNKKNSINIILKNSLGKHNALNATASIIVSLKLNINKNKIINSLCCFPGVLNRMDFLGKYNFINNKFKISNITFISDYGHHPSEIICSINTVKNMKYNKLILIFQPHRFTRTYDLKNDFINIFSKINNLILLDIYSANEDKMYIDGLKLFNLIKLKNNNIIFISNNKYILENLIKILENNDLVLIQGAGNVHNIFKNILLNFFKIN